MANAFNKWAWNYPIESTEILEALDHPDFPSGEERHQLPGWAACIAEIRAKLADSDVAIPVIRASMRQLECISIQNAGSDRAERLGINPKEGTFIALREELSRFIGVRVNLGTFPQLDKVKEFLERNNYTFSLESLASANQTCALFAKRIESILMFFDADTEWEIASDLICSFLQKVVEGHEVTLKRDTAKKITRRSKTISHAEGKIGKAPPSSQPIVIQLPAHTQLYDFDGDTIGIIRRGGTTFKSLLKRFNTNSNHPEAFGIILTGRQKGRVVMVHRLADKVNPRSARLVAVKQNKTLGSLMEFTVGYIE